MNGLPPILYKRHVVAALGDIPPRTVAYWLDSGELPAHQMADGKNRWITPEALEYFAKQRNLKCDLSRVFDLD
jgi:hypothetical protein